jgi:hypothetical protein
MIDVDEADESHSFIRKYNSILSKRLREEQQQQQAEEEEIQSAKRRKFSAKPRNRKTSDDDEDEDYMPYKPATTIIRTIEIPTTTIAIPPPSFPKVILYQQPQPHPHPPSKPLQPLAIPPPPRKQMPRISTPPKLNTKPLSKTAERLRTMNLSDILTLIKQPLYNSNTI